MRSNKHLVFSESDRVHPFLKWPGGKRWLAREIAGYISTRLRGRYFEPFLGGGAVFFALQPQQAILSDANEDLINTYWQVRNNSSTLITRLRAKRVTSNNYYRIRAQQPTSAIERAIRFLYLNRTAFAGMYRINREGQFNVPFGGGARTPSALWEKHLLANASRALQRVELRSCDFEEVIAEARSGDAIYCDPTYTVAHENNGFVRYNERNFSWTDQKRLAVATRRAAQRGVCVVVSNAYHRSIRELYEPCRPRVRTRHSLMSPDARTRRQIKEYLYLMDCEPAS